MLTMNSVVATDATHGATTTEAPVESYVPPTVWKWVPDEGSNKFGSMNRPTAGSRFDKELPVGKHPIQLYSLGTPNGQKVTIMLEELLEMGYSGAEYDAWYIDIMKLDHFGSEFVKMNPNSKIPSMMDQTDKDKPQRVFESGAMLLYLSEKCDNAFLPVNHRQEVLNWLFWQMASTPYVGGGFGHFYQYAKEKQQYPIDRFTMELKRQLDVLNNILKERKYVACDNEYTIADIAIFPWYGQICLGKLYTGESLLLTYRWCPIDV
eukprot:g5390.t1.1.5e174189 g5390  g5390.t1 contig2:445574-446534(+)